MARACQPLRRSVHRFAEPDPARGSKPVPNAWFAVNDNKPLAFFAGIWASQWEGVRKLKEGLVSIDLFAFLTTEPNGLVAPVHERAMPVILTSRDEVEKWLTALYPHSFGPDV